VRWLAEQIKYTVITIHKRGELTAMDLQMALLYAVNTWVTESHLINQQLALLYVSNMIRVIRLFFLQLQLICGHMRNRVIFVPLPVFDRLSAVETGKNARYSISIHL